LEIGTSKARSNLQFPEGGDMVDQATIQGVAFPSSKVVMEIKVTADLNVSAFVARQRANHFLIVEAGDQLCAGEPELSVSARLAWRVPIQYAPSRRGVIGIVGHLLVDAETGEVTLADGQTTEDLMRRAEMLDARPTL
jgi:hypothetical protein